MNGFSCVVRTCFILLLFSCAIKSNAQIGPTDSVYWNKFVPPAPIVGWDSLLQKIKYPELCRHARIEGSGIVRLTIDTNGTIASMVFNNLIELFQDSIKSAFASTYWLPGLYDGKPKNIEIAVPVEFYLYNYTTPRRLLIGGRAYIVGAQE